MGALNKYMIHLHQYLIDNTPSVYRKIRAIPRLSIGVAIMAVIIMGICLDINDKPIEYVRDAVVETAQAEEVQKPVMIEIIYPKEESRMRLIKQYFPEDYDNAIKVFRCESHLMQEKDGVTVTGPTQDKGIAQIHVPTHGKELARLGLDVNDIEDNLKFARILYDQYGWKPWVCAKIEGVI
jgi:hypothetical protein